MATRTKKPTGKTRFNLTLTTEASRDLTKLSRGERRSKSNMLEMLIRRETERTIQEAA